MKIIVTGGCGFIGSHLVNKLVDMDYDVHVIDDCSADNNKFYFNDKATYYKESICDYLKIESIFKDVHTVFHLAAEARLQASIENPIYCTNVNVLGTVNVLNACKVHNIQRIIYSGTSAVYGLTENFPTNEETVIDCLNPYAATKYSGEEMIRCFTKLYNMDSCIFRYFNVYGENSPVTGPYSLVIGRFLNQKQNNMPLTVVGDGFSKRDFIHVSDVVSVNIKAMQHSKKLNASIFNIGFGKNYQIINIAKYISSNIEYVPSRQGEAKTTLANIKKTEDVLGWKPSVDLFNWIDNNK
jgi:UDP-glucose 4-epimerase|tara:strand:+ start:445 stop:1335 length:891 start_codon:yes stop_codon:yes gene_type:complete